MKQKISLSRLAISEMKDLNAGYEIRCVDNKCCGCGCYYASSGGSSTTDNQNANFDDALHSPFEP